MPQYFAAYRSQQKSFIALRPRQLDGSHGVAEANFLADLVVKRCRYQTGAKPFLWI